MRDCATCPGNRSRPEKETGTAREFAGTVRPTGQSSEKRASSSWSTAARPSPCRTSSATRRRFCASASSSCPNEVRFSRLSPRARSFVSFSSAAISCATPGATAAGQRTRPKAPSVFERDHAERSHAPVDLRLRRPRRREREELHEIGPRRVARRDDDEVPHPCRLGQRAAETVGARAAGRRPQARGVRTIASSHKRRRPPRRR